MEQLKRAISESLQGRESREFIQAIDMRLQSEIIRVRDSIKEDYDSTLTDEEFESMLKELVDPIQNKYGKVRLDYLRIYEDLAKELLDAENKLKKTRKQQEYLRK